MKRKILNLLFVLLFIIGFGVLAYPAVSNEWNTYLQNRIIADYEARLASMEVDDYSNEWAAARAFNANITSNDIYTDVFGEDNGQEAFEQTEYYQILNVNGDGIMGYVSIPKIDVKLSIHHGTSEEVIQRAVGHLNGTSLPIGGESTHSVISGHRGLPSVKLFTDIDQLEPGDKFYIHVLDETLAYSVDQILPMIDANDMEALSEALQIVPGQDHVTLFTCTPYGVNTHRLLVRGTRVEYLGEDDVPTGVEAVVAEVHNYYLIILIAGVIVAAVLIFVINRIINKNKKAETNVAEGGNQ